MLKPTVGMELQKEEVSRGGGEEAKEGVEKGKVFSATTTLRTRCGKEDRLLDGELSALAIRIRNVSNCGSS
jgi:hypothetical protein